MTHDNTRCLFICDHSPPAYLTTNHVSFFVACACVEQDAKLDRRKYLGMTVFEPICVLKEAHLYR